MAVLSCFIWGGICTITLYIFLKFFLPELRVESPEFSEQKGGLSGEGTLGKLHILFIVISVAIAMSCGFASGNRQDAILSMAKMILALCVLNIITITDIEFYKIPNKCVLVLVLGRCLSIIPELMINDENLILSLINSVVAGVFSMVFLYIMLKITQGGLGYGDIKLFGALGFLCGVRAVVYTLILSVFLCAIASAILLAIKKKKLKDALPMGPFIWIGFALTVIIGLC